MPTLYVERAAGETGDDNGSEGIDTFGASKRLSPECEIARLAIGSRSLPERTHDDASLGGETNASRFSRCRRPDPACRRRYPTRLAIASRSWPIQSWYRPVRRGRA